MGHHLSIIITAIKELLTQQVLHCNDTWGEEVGQVDFVHRQPALPPDSAKSLMSLPMEYVTPFNPMYMHIPTACTHKIYA